MVVHRSEYSVVRVTTHEHAEHLGGMDRCDACEAVDVMTGQQGGSGEERDCRREIVWNVSDRLRPCQRVWTSKGGCGVERIRKVSTGPAGNGKDDALQRMVQQHL